MSENPQSEVLTPEVLPPEGQAPRPPRRSRADRLAMALLPIVGGFLIDLIDRALFGPVGFLFGGMAGFWLSSVYRMPLRHRLLIAMGSALYGAMRVPRFIPLATALGAYLTIRQALKGGDER